MSSVVISGDTSGSITLAAPAVSGTNTATLPAATGVIMVSGNMPAFSAYQSAATSLSTGAYTKVLFGNETFDTNNNFASSTFTPTVAGYYQINASVGLANGQATRTRLVIYKNGSQYCAGTDISTAYITGNVSSLVSMNGSTDYLEIYVYQSSGIAQLTDTNSFTTQFSGSLVRAA